MFSLANVKARTYEFEHPDTHLPLYIRPPKLEVLNTFNVVMSNHNATPEELAECIALFLANNTKRVPVSTKMVLEWMTADDAAAFIEDFMGWINSTQENDPN